MNDDRVSPGRRTVAIALSVVAILLAIGFGWRSVRNADENPLTQDAVLSANVVNIAASVPGRVASFHVSDNASVKRGDLLFALDPDYYRLQVLQATADLRIAEAASRDRKRTIAADQSNAAIANEQVARARSNLDLATQTYQRLEPLGPKGYVTAQQLDDAGTVKRGAEISLNQAKRQQTAAEALVSNTAAAEALVDARRAALAIAEHALANTEMRAPFDGKVVGLTVAPGEYVLPGQSLFTLIDVGAWYASALFEETELAHIAVGNCATVYALSDRSAAIRGRVEGIGWGVTSEDIIALPRKLPFVPKTLDWVRVAQRFPVRIRLVEPPENLMRIGASATATVHHGTRC